MRLARILIVVCCGLLAASLVGTAAPPAPPIPAELKNNIHMRWGYPGGNCRILAEAGFIICEDVAHRLPQWVGYHLTRADLHGSATRQNNFHADDRLERGARSENADYAKSGYDKGHMAPAADFKRTVRAMSETFLLSNMTPQRPNLNRRIWEHLESEVRGLAKAHGSIWIFTGPLYLNRAATQPIAPDSFIGRDRVAVPTHFFKVVLCEHANNVFEMFAFILPNQESTFTHDAAFYLKTVRNVEQLSGLDFFDVLPDPRENQLETTRAPLWPVPQD